MTFEASDIGHVRTRRCAKVFGRPALCRQTAALRGDGSRKVVGAYRNATKGRDIEVDAHPMRRMLGTSAGADAWRRGTP
jgi:hypothetical protein